MAEATALGASGNVRTRTSTGARPFSRSHAPTACSTFAFRLPVLVWDRVAEGPGERHVPAALVAELAQVREAARRIVQAR